jgi:hypothetical protein
MYYVPIIALLHSTAMLYTFCNMASPSTPKDSVLYPTLSSGDWESLDELNKQLKPLGLYLNSPELAILCRTCKYALKPSEKSNTVTRHLSKHNISLLQHKQLANFIRTLHLPDPKNLPLRQDDSPRHLFLATREGVTCTHCTYRTTSKDGTTFERPLNYTPKLSAIIHCIRLVLLESTLPRLAHLHIGWEARPRRGQLSLLNNARVGKMCLGSQAPMGELLSLRSYGRAWCCSEGPSFRVEWSEDGQVVSWEKHRLSMT